MSGISICTWPEILIITAAKKRRLSIADPHNRSQHDLNGSNHMTLEKQDDIQTDEQTIQQAISILVGEQRVSIALLQRHLRLGYAKAVALMKALEARGVVRYFNPEEIRELTPAYRR
jgi:DNA segregation ATPase FtsK/SpoIIIE-like protein